MLTFARDRTLRRQSKWGSFFFWGGAVEAGLGAAEAALGAAFARLLSSPRPNLLRGTGGLQGGFIARTRRVP
jgi:hypothetical protein